MKLKILNLNIWIGGILWDEMVEFLKKENPDILLTQEVYNGDESFQKKQYRSFSELKKILGFEHASFAPTFTENSDEKDETGNFKEVVQGNAIFSKFPLEEVSTTFYDVPFGKRDPYDDKKYHVTPRNLQHVIAKLDGTKLHLLNTQGIWGKHGRDTDRRLEMAESILKEVANLHPLLIAGDFNVDSDTKTTAKIEVKLVSVFKDFLKTSFNVKRKNLIKDPGFASAVVDMMFVSPDVKIKSKKVPIVDVSDHLPLVCEIEI